ncbi:MAG: DUF934 domain-containing protein [Pseudomonadota bacterium]
MTESRLWNTEGFVTDDPWRVVGEEETTPVADANARLLLSLARYLELSDDDRKSGTFGVVLSPDDDVVDMEPHLGNLQLVAVTFPAFSDGRAFSQASLLRDRLGFDGELRAHGDVLIDQIPLMLRCGIDSFSVTNATAIRRLAEGRLPGISAHYQPATKPSRTTGSYAWRRVQEPA